MHGIHWHKNNVGLVQFMGKKCYARELGKKYNFDVRSNV